MSFDIIIKVSNICADVLLSRNHFYLSRIFIRQNQNEILEEKRSESKGSDSNREKLVLDKKFLVNIMKSQKPLQ